MQIFWKRFLNVDHKKKVLIVCTGNSCRSVMAEGLLKDMLSKAGRNDIEVFSAGVGTLGGMSPTIETITVMRDVGIDVSGYQSTLLTDEAIRGADLILVMEGFHRDEIIRRIPKASKKTFLLKKFGRDSSGIGPYTGDVADPIGRPLEDYRKTFREIKSELERILKLI